MKIINRFIKDPLLTVALQSRLLLFVFYKQTKRRLVFIFIYELDDLLVVHIHYGLRRPDGDTYVEDDI